MPKYKATIEYVLDIEADSIKLATKLAKDSVPTHTRVTTAGNKGVGSAEYGGFFAVKVEAVKGGDK